MPNLHVLHTSTGKEPDPAMLTLLCNGDVSAKLTDCGLDLRPYFAVSPSRPVPFRVVSPEHGAWPAAMHRPTRRERLAAWWRAHYRALFWLLVPWVSVIALYLAVCLAMDAGNALADWLSALWQ